jgi:multidrug efflux pump
MTSTSSAAVRSSSLQFALYLNIDVAEQEVQAAINAAQTYLPPDLPGASDLQQDQSRRRADPHSGADLQDHSAFQVEDLADTRLAQKISQLPGVGLVSISGGQKPAVRVQVNPTALSSYGMNLEDVRTALQQTSLDLAKGNFDGPRQDYQIDAPTTSCSPARITTKVVIAYHNGAPVMLSDVANGD